MVPIEGGNEGVDRSNDFVVAIVNGGEPTHVGPAHNRVLALGPRQEVAVLLVAVVDGLVPRALGIHIHNGVQEAAARGDPGASAIQPVCEALEAVPGSASWAADELGRSTLKSWRLRTQPSLQRQTQRHAYLSILMHYS